MRNFRKHAPLILFLLLILLTVGIIYFSFSHHKASNIMKVAFLDIGQGDAIFIEAPNGKQMLIDAGPGPIILSKLSQVMPFADRSIDLIVATHTDADHIGGFSSVLDKYTVGQVIENGARNTTKTYRNFEDKIKQKNIPEIIAGRGTSIILDKERNVHFDVLFPDRDISSLDSNDGSIVGRLVYRNESFMLTGDATAYTELLITKNETAATLHSNVLKLGHHGSKYSSTDFWLRAVTPEISVISAGLHNRYGHPHQEVLDRLASLHIPSIATYQKGTVIFKTDGLTLSHN